MVDSLHLHLFPLWLRNDLKINSIESLWIEINDLIVGVIYKPPSVWNSEFLDKLETSHLNIIFFFGKNALLWVTLAWKNSRYFATLPLVSPPKLRLRNERRNSILMTRHYPDLGSDASSVWNFFARISDFIWWGNQPILFSQARMTSISTLENEYF